MSQHDGEPERDEAEIGLSHLVPSMKSSPASVEYRNHGNRTSTSRSLQSARHWASIPRISAEHFLKIREIIPCQTCNRDIEDLETGLVVWCTTKDKPGAPSIKVVHAQTCDPWKGNAPHSRPLVDFRDHPEEIRRQWAALVKDGGMAAVMAWEVLGRIYTDIPEKEFFRVEAPTVS